MRLIVRKERPHPGAQSRITDAYGIRLTCFALGATAIALVPLAVRFGTRSPPREGRHLRRTRTHGPPEA
jgi:hypothetical protein